ncbi:hypothetical protein G2W53_039521 [Senna tora]|uniref:Uncharacterized protein n=1 Tax=Senna tora TaxID=362788 RepID=A0A834SQZ2_9FABA|nr:hypothetical protein G2W53_039521 [Senna tora]
MREKNRENRSKLKMPHTCGSKSMARKKHEMELASGKPVSRGAVFVATHKRKDGSYVNDNAKIVSIRDVTLQEIARLKLQLEANKSQTKSFMTFVLRNLGLESVPPEFADLINPQVSDANSVEPSSMGHQSSQA